MNLTFFKELEIALATERLDAYRQDKAIPSITLARYLWNMALCESLYSPLQIVEIALRNAFHRCLSNQAHSEEWYVKISNLTEIQKHQIQEAGSKLSMEAKAVTPGRMVAELHFGFWTSFFNKYHANSGIGHMLASHAFPHAPKTERDMKKLDRRLNKIRKMRNRVFHHERIIHWNDLDSQHADLLELIRWISPELHELSATLDRFSVVRKAGREPWAEKIRHHWPLAPHTLCPNASIACVPSVLDVKNGAETPFGHRWGGDVFHLTDIHLEALLSDQALALDIGNEYVVFLKRPSITIPVICTNPQI